MSSEDKISSIRADDPWMEPALVLLSLEDAHHPKQVVIYGVELGLSKLIAMGLDAIDKSSYPDANGTCGLAMALLRDTPQVVSSMSPLLECAALRKSTVLLMNFRVRLPHGLELNHTSESKHHSSLVDDVPVNFISDLDIVGGNSGSPTLNEHGQLVGVAFDLNTQGIAANWMYGGSLSRVIHVDIRYILWILENRAPSLYTELLRDEGADL